MKYYREKPDGTIEEVSESAVKEFLEHGLIAENPASDDEHVTYGLTPKGLNYSTDVQ